MFDNDDSRAGEGASRNERDTDSTRIVAPDDTVIGGSAVSGDTVIRDAGAGRVADQAADRAVESPISDDDRKRFFRPPVATPGSTVPLEPRVPPITTPVIVPPPVVDDLSKDEPPTRKSFDEIISGEFHRMTDAIPIIGRNLKGEPRRGIVVIGIVFALAVLAGGVVAAVVLLTVR